MLKVMPIDLVRQVIVQTLLIERLKNPKYFGDDDQVQLFSFYEQVQEEHEVDRYVETYRELTEQQNRTGLIMNGTIVAPENPQIVNVHEHTIIPLEFSCAFQGILFNRDAIIETINNMIGKLKGRKQDIAIFDNGKSFMVGTMLNDVTGSLVIKNGDYIGDLQGMDDVTGDLGELCSTLYSSYGIALPTTDIYVYFSSFHKLYVAWYDSNNNEFRLVERADYETIETYKDIVFPPEHESFEKYQVSISFDTIRVDQPLTVNSNELCTISFGGSATIVDDTVVLGNQLTRVGIRKKKIEAQSTINLPTNGNPIYWLETLEMPNSLGISGEIDQRISTMFVQNKHNDGINPTFNYSFVLDFKNPLIKQFWNYARYGKLGTNANNYLDGVTPNMIYELTEIMSSWGQIERNDILVKATENIDVENTESDALSIKINFEMQR